MIQQLSVKLFGGLEIHVQPVRPLKFVSLRAELLIAWLATHPGQHRREMVAELFWAERDQTRSLGNLRTLLARLPKPVKSFLQVTPQTLGVDPEQSIYVDLFEFDRLMARANHKEAESLFNGNVLAGVHVEDSQGLHEWITILQEEYRQKGIDLLQALAESGLRQRALGQGILYAQKLVQLDPLREASYRLLMWLLARNGRRGEALKVYETCVQMLKQEFEIEPEPATATLANRLQSGQKSLHNLPLQPTPFIGRGEELAALRELLASENKRLISIVGPGGMGKTRIALECGRQLDSHFLDGMAFIPLSGVERPELVDVTIGATLSKNGFIPANTTNLSPAEHLYRHLKNKEMLLILDNFEHLIDAAPLLSELLHRSTSLKLLVTSRTRLGLQWEHLVELQGLQYATDVSDDNWLASDAVRLFLQTTQRIIPELTLTVDDRRALTEICTLVGSLPLALELAAKWVRIHSCPEILAEIRKNIEFLINTDRDVPERHRSILAVFDYSWQQLSAEEQNCLARMAVFRGHFDFTAANQITNATQTVLVGLIDHCLLNRIDDDRQGRVRFELHSLLREFAWRRLAQSSDILEEVQQSHIQYYLQQLSENGVEKSGRKKWSSQRIKADLDNIRAAWDGAIKNGMWPLLVAASKPLSEFWQHEGLNQEGAESLRRAVKTASDKAPSSVVLEFRLELIRFLRNLSQYEAAFAEIEEAVKLLDDNKENQFVTANVYLLWGEILTFRSMLDMANEKLSTSLEIASRIEDARLIGESYRLIGQVAFYKGDMQQAEKNLQVAYLIFQENSDLPGIAKTQNNLGMVYKADGDMTEAIRWYKKAVMTWEEVGDLQSVLRGKTNLGHTLTLTGRFKEGLAMLKEIQSKHRESGKIRGEGHAFRNMGRAYISLGQYETAEKCLMKGLHLFQQAGVKSGEVGCKIFLASLYRNWGKHKEAQLRAEQAHSLASESGNQTVLVAAIICLGYLSLDEGDAVNAQDIFAKALETQIHLGWEQWQHESRAGLAAAALLAGEETKAQDLLLPHAADLNFAALLVALQPFSVILTYVQVLQTCEPGLADQILKMGLEMLATWEKEAPDEASRESVRTAVPAHRALLAYADQNS